jgi:hypothetical protein
MELSIGTSDSRDGLGFLWLKCAMLSLKSLVRQNTPFLALRVCEFWSNSDGVTNRENADYSYMYADTLSIRQQVTLVVKFERSMSSHDNLILNR